MAMPLEDGGIGQQRREIVHQSADGIERQFPVSDGRQLGGQVTYAREPEDFRSGQTDFRINRHTEGHGGRQGLAAAFEGQAGLRTAEAVVGQRRRHGDIGDASQERHIFGNVEGLAAAESNDRPGAGWNLREQFPGLFKRRLLHRPAVENLDAFRLESITELVHQVHLQIGAVQDDDFLKPVAAGIDTHAAGGAGFDAHQGGDGDLGAHQGFSNR
jgi:hypothetical protein